MSDTEHLIHQTAVFVEKELSNEGSGHDWQHVWRVWKNAKRLGPLEHADMQVVELAALLHDIDDWKIAGAKPGDEPVKAKAFLEQQGCTDNLVKTVCDVIATIDFKGSLDTDRDLTLEAKVVFDADKLDAIGAVGIARCFTFNGHTGRPMFLPDVFPDDDLDQAAYTNLKRDANTGINHFFDKLLRLKNRMYTDAGKVEAQKRHDVMVSFLNSFFDEVNAAEWQDHLKAFLEAA